MLRTAGAGGDNAGVGGITGIESKADTIFVNPKNGWRARLIRLRAHECKGPKLITLLDSMDLSDVRLTVDRRVNLYDRLPAAWRAWERSF